MTPSLRLERNLFPATPPERLAALRILIGLYSTVYLLTRGTYLMNMAEVTRQAFAPVGVVNLLAQPLPPWFVLALYGLTLFASASATLGFRYRLTGPLWGLGLLWVLSYRNSWGMIFHTDNLLVLDALVLMFAPAADAWSLDARTQETRAAADRYAWPITTLNFVLVATYWVAGIAKLRAVGLNWLGGDELREHIAFDALRKIELGSVHSPLAPFLVSHPGWLLPFSWLSLALEVLAPLALLGRRAASSWALGAWLFHAGVVLTMAIVFPYPLLGVAFASLFPCERLAARWIVPVFTRRRPQAHR